MEIEDLADYILTRPKPPPAPHLEKAEKASAHWRHVHNLRIMRQNLLEAAKHHSRLLSGWQTPITAIEPEPGVTATVLTSAQELARESLNLAHCVGSERYAEGCADGNTRIIHIQPSPAVEDPDAPDGCGTTLEIYVSGNAWRQGQHRGRHNRAPTPAEECWARIFLERWRQAMKQRADRILRELAENEEYEEEAL